MVVHGNGPHVSPLAHQSGSYPGAEPYPLDVLDAGHQGMIGYLIQKELRNLLPPLTPVATVLTMITVDPDDPAFARPSTFVGPVYHQDASDTLAAKRGWTFRRLGHVTPGELAGYQFPGGSIGPKVEAAVRFAAKTGNRAAIGALADIPRIVAGRAGTNVIMRSDLRTTVPAPSGGGVTAVTAGTETGEATPRRTWNPARRGPGPIAGAG